MQIVKAQVTPLELKLRQPVRFAGSPEIKQVTAVFVRLDARTGQSAWGCAVVHPALTAEKPEEVIQACRACAALIPDLHPLNLEYTLGELAKRVKMSPAVCCAYDLAFHDLLSLSAGIPLYRLLGGYRNRIQTSVTIDMADVPASVEQALQRASLGFQILKVKGGMDPGADVQRVEAIHRALPNHTLRLDADGGYAIRDALDVARALKDCLEMIEQPVAEDDLAGLRQMTELSPVPVLADQSVRGPDTALHLASNKVVNGMSIKLAACGGLLAGRQIDTIARAAKMATMVSCFYEPAMLISAGLSLALSSPNVRYGDLDGNLDLLNDPSRPGFRLEDGWLVASEVPGLGYSVEL